MQPTRIAIVGSACRYPDARSPEELWENALAQRRAFRRIPAERLSLADYFSADRAAADAIYSTQAAVLADYQFDRNRFRIAGRTFRAVDMTHWLALEVADEALISADFPHADGMPRTETGVYIGNSLTGEFSRANLMRLRWPYVRRVLDAELAQRDWPLQDRDAFLNSVEQSYKAPFPPVNDETLAGGLANTIAGRICNYYDFQGGGYTVDGACASSLLAVATACSALASGDVDVALAGGVDLSLDPFELIGFSKVGALATDEMRVYDLHSAGFWPGEGCGIVVLMRLEDARRLGRPVLAAISGWGISSDGAGGLTRPELQGHKLALARAYRRAGFGIETVDYFEGHGTGTGVGDSTELRALSQARRTAGGAPPPAAVGSIKANIGHTKAAAGVAGLLKAAMAVNCRLLPPSTGWSQPHPAIAEEGHQLRLLAEGEPWPADRPVRAGVSAMGFGGINAHVVLEGVETPRRLLVPHIRRLLSSSQDAELILLAADNAGDLVRKLQDLAPLAQRISRSDLTDLACRLAKDLAPGKVRAALVVSRPQELADGLARLNSWLAEGTLDRLDIDAGTMLGCGHAPPRIGYLFSGQGTSFTRIGGLWARRFDLARQLYSFADLPLDGDDAATDVAQPAIIAASLAGLDLLGQCGFEAHAGIGHSLGELAAYHWAGAIDKPALLRLAHARGKAMAQHGRRGGAMASIAAGEEIVAPIAARNGFVLAGLNTPRQTVVSGAEAAIDAVVERMKRAGFAATRLHVSQAFHSPFMDIAAGVLRDALRRERFHPLTAKVISTVTGSPLAAHADLRDILFQQMTTPVRFAAAVGQAGKDIDLWIEVGPGHVLAGMMPQLHHAPAIPLDAGGPSLKGLLKAFAAAFALGAPVSAQALFENRFHRAFDPAHQPSFLANPCEQAPQCRPDWQCAEHKVENAPRAPNRAEAEAPPAAATVTGADSPLEVVRRLAARRAELPVETVGKDLRLLVDLHLSSIAVAQLVTESARALGLEPPAWPTEAANATIAEVADALAQLVENSAHLAENSAHAGWGPAAEPRTESLPGLAAWTRPFTIELVECSMQRRGDQIVSQGAACKIIADEGNPLRTSLPEQLDRASPGGGVALLLPPNPDEQHIDLLLAAAREVLSSAGRNKKFLLVQHGGGAASFARSLHLECPEVAVCVVDVPVGHPQAAKWIAAEASASRGYVEAHYDAEGSRREPRLRFLEEDAGSRDGRPLGPEDVLLVTGGGKGIGAESAFAVAKASGVRLALMGRSHAADDTELAANLKRFADFGIAFHYYPADVCDADAVRRAVEDIEDRLGPLTGVLHSAGANRPQRLDSLDRDAFLATLNPKVQGLRNVLAAVRPERLRLLVAFGSIIARTGMPGEADYAVANEWMTRLVERWQAEHADCRCLAVEWSVWSGVGMGERLGSIDALRAQGISPISPDAGVAGLKQLLVRGPSPVAVIVTGRFGNPPTLKFDRPELPLLRFLERAALFVPGVELIAEADLSLGTDPYVSDHVYQGAHLFPAVMGLEAMAQAAKVLCGPSRPAAFEDVSFTRPVVVPREGSLTIRLVALRTAPDRVEVALRSQETDFQADHFRAVCHFRPEARRDDFTESVAKVEAIGRELEPLDPEADLYGRILFQRGRLQRVRGYRLVRATECVAEIESRPDSWFSQYLPGELVLGDPGARDAVLHGIQACIPHGALLPTGVDLLTIFAPLAATSYLHARERSRDGVDFVYDVDVTDERGTLLERWTGLQLRCIRTATAKGPWAAPLLAVYLQRRLQELIPGPAVSIALEACPASDCGAAEGYAAGNGAGRHSAGNGAMQRALGSRTDIHRRGDGKPECVRDSVSVSASHCGNLTLAISGGATVACDIEAVVVRPAATWGDILGPLQKALAELVARESGDDFDAAATRVWSAAECLKKAGLGFDAPLALGSARPDGWVLMESGAYRVASTVVALRGQPNRLSVAMLVETFP